MAAGVVRTKLIALSHTVESYPINAVVTALVIAKSEPNIFLGKQTSTSEWRGVITYTVRDSKRDIVNCKYWGSKEKVEEYHRRLQIGDIIDIICPRVVPRPDEAAAATSDRFQPVATLRYTLVLNEGQSYFDKHPEYRNDTAELRNLLHQSHKPLCTALTLADVRSSAAATAADQLSNTPAQYVDLLVAIVAMRSAKELCSSRTGQMLHCLEVIVCDQSAADGDGAGPTMMVLTIWNSNWIRRAQDYWRPRRTVLHLIDVRVGHSQFHKSAALSLTARTLVYENPLGSETQKLLEYASTVPFKDFDGEQLPTPDQIVTQMSVKQIYARAEGNLQEPADAERFSAVLYAMITKFDIDGQSSIISRKCKFCQRLMANNQIYCNSDQCQLAFSLNDSGEHCERFFNINLQLSDHTGTLVETRLTGSIAERLLAVGIEEYIHWSDEQKEQLKWRYLMEHCVAKVLVKKANAVRRNLSIVLVDMQLSQLEELAQKIMVF